MTGGGDPLSPAGRAARVRHVELQACLWGARWHDAYDDGEHLARLPDNQLLDDGLALAAERVEQLAGVALSTRPGGIAAVLGGGYRGVDTGESALYQRLAFRYDEEADRLAIETVDGDPLLVVPGPTLRAGLVERRAER